jgi:hypothetical protein
MPERIFRCRDFTQKEAAENLLISDAFHRYITQCDTQW